MENIQIETYDGSGQEVFEDGSETIIVVHEVPNSKLSSETEYVPYKFSTTSDIIIATSSSPNSMPSLSSLTTLPSMAMPSSLTSLTNASSMVLSGAMMGQPQLVSRNDSKKGEDSEASWFSSGAMFSEVRQGTNFVTTTSQSADGSVHLPTDFDSNMVEVMITEKTSIDPKEELDFEDADQEDEDGGCLVTLHLDSSLFRHCPVCGGIIGGYEEMKQHCENCLGPNMYKIQEHKTNKINVAADRKKSTGLKMTRFSCSTCDRKFANKKSFEKHRYWCDPNVLLADYAVAENTDLSSYGVSNLKDEHFIGHLDKADIKLSTIKEEDGGGVARLKNADKGKVVKKPSHTCPKCAKTFSSPAYMKTHMRIHTGERPFSCNSCGKSFNDRTALRNHDKTHTNERPYSCNTCGKSFRRSDSLKYHAASHTGDRPFICAHCAKSFKNQRDLKMHEKCVHGDGSAAGGEDRNSGIHACNDCNMICESLSALKFHKRITHGQGKTYDCEYCGKKCLASSQLEIHLRSHTGDKPFKCSHCDKAFRRQSHLQVHEQRHTGFNVFRCTQCNKGFPQKVELKQHEKIHSGQKPYQCGLCGKCFAREDYVRIHMKTHGPQILPSIAEGASAAIGLVTKQAASVPTKTVYVMEPDVPGGSGGHSAMLGLAHVRGDKEVGATIVIPAGHSVINSGQHNEIFRQIPGLNVVQDGTVQFKIS